MSISIDIKEEAKCMPYDGKKYFILSLPETELHKRLKSLFEKMFTNEGPCQCEITHSSDEYGRDLVVKRVDALGEHFVGVVVKKAKGELKGDKIRYKITGKTSGLIDDVISQSNQAISHSCFLREIAAGSRRITEVWVVFAGELTGNASKRIDAELQKVPFRIFLIGDLVEKFTEYYPQIFFEGKVAEYIEKQIISLESKQDFTIRPISLSASYVDPWVAKSDISGDMEDEMLQSILRKDKMPFRRLEEVIQKSSRIILVGDAGSGKSTALLKIAVDILYGSFHKLIARKSKEMVEVPVILKATELLKYDTSQQLKDEYLHDQVGDKFRIGVLLVDGLDELKLEDQQIALDKAKIFSSGIDCGLVISSRRVAAIKELEPSFQRYELLPFDYNQAVTLMERLVKDKALLEMLKEGLQGEEMNHSILTPLAIQLLVEIAETEREIPASLTEIYSQYTDIAVGKYDLKRGIESLFSYYIKKQFLAELAWYEYYSKDRLRINKEEFNRFIDKYIEIYKREKGKLHDLIREVERSGILRIGGEVFFKHRSFLDYFAALRLYDNREEIKNLDNEIANIYLDEQWSDIAFYYTGLIKRLTKKMIDIIDRFEKQGLYVDVMKMAIGRLLQAGWNSPASIRKYGIETAIKYMDPIREQLTSNIEHYPKKVPAIFVEFIIMGISEYSFGSKTIARDALEIFDNLLAENNARSMLKALALLWANRNRLEETEGTQRMKNMLTVLSNLEKEGKLEAEDKIKTLLFLNLIDSEDKNLLRSIDRKTKRLSNQYPSEWRRLLPAPKKGFRKKRR